jgi:hypothetical protein
MAKKAASVDVSGLSEFIPTKDVVAPKHRVVVTVSKEDHATLTKMSEAASGSSGRFVSLGVVVNSLIQHYQSYE